MKQVKLSEESLLRRSQLQERGWTPAMIRDLLGEPDEHRDNPVYKSQPPMALYSLNRVEAVEATSAFQVRASKGRQRSTVGKRGAAARRKETLAWAEAVQIRVPLEEAVAEKAVAAYNARKAARARDDWEPATLDSGEAFLQRITVNYIRHRLTDYDGLLVAKYGAVGVEEARHLIRRRVYGAIAATYPALADECQRQWAKRLENYGAPSTG